MNINSVFLKVAAMSASLALMPSLAGVMPGDRSDPFSQTVTSNTTSESKSVEHVEIGDSATDLNLAPTPCLADAEGVELDIEGTPLSPSDFEG